MRSNSLNYFAVGLFVLVMLAALVLALALLTGRTGPTDTYYTRYRAANGLKYGTAVLYMGYPVGQVESIEPSFGSDGNGEGAGALEFVVRMSVDEGWRIPTDSVAQVRAAGLLAAVTIDIRAGDSAVAAEPGSFIEGQAQVDLFGAMSDTANTVRQLTEGSVRPLVESLDRYVQVLGENLERDAGPLLTDLRRIAAELAGRAPALIDAFLAVGEDVRQVSARLEALLGEQNVDRVDATVANLERTSQHLLELADNTRRQLDGLLGEGTRTRVHGTLDDVAGLSRDARERLDEVMGPDTAQRLGGALDNVSRAAANIAELGADLRGAGGQVRRILGGLEQTVERGRPDVEQSLDDLRYTLRMLAEHVDAVAYNLEGTSRNMYEFSRELRMNPGLLLGGTPPADAAVPPAPAGRN